MIRYIDRNGTEHVGDLFAVLAALARDEVTSFPALRPHQRQAWHCFLVQVGALALQRAGEDVLPEFADGWRERLIALTPDHPDGEAWQLVVDDWSVPALLQPPGMSPPGSKGVKVERTPDALDMLVTGRNHDVKGERIGDASADEWLFALVTLQTLEGQNGAPNYGISRMYTGFGARVYVGVRPLPDRWGRSIRRDIEHLLAARDEIEAVAPMRGDIGLLWTLPWDGSTSLSVAALDPLYIDTCRRVRLTGDANGPKAAARMGSKVARIAAAELNGTTGDPWAPVRADASKSWGVGHMGFGYRQVTNLLAAESTVLPPLAKVSAADLDGPIALYAVAITRGRGGTDGFHERYIPFPSKAARKFGRPEGRRQVGDVAVARRDAAGVAQKILRHALFALYQGGPDKARLDDDATGAKAADAMTAFDAAIDAAFFAPDFWDAIERAETSDDELDPTRAWRERLAKMAQGVLERAQEASPRTHMRYHRAVAKSTTLLRSRMRRFVDPTADSDARTNGRETRTTS